MDDYIIILTAGIVCVLITDSMFFRPFRTAREVFLVMAGWLMMGYWLYSGAHVSHSKTIISAAGAMIVSWVVSTTLSIAPRIAVREALKFVFAFFIGFIMLARADRGLCIQVLVSLAALNAGVAVLQNVCRVEIFADIKPVKKYAPTGLIGNPNELAAYLLPHLFMAAWLMKSGQYLWAAPGVLILWGLYLTKCRAAMIGLACGTVFLFRPCGWEYMSLYGLILFFLFAAAVSAWAWLWLTGKVRIRDLHTLRERMNYWLVACEQIKKTPIFGTGFNCLKTRVYEHQRKLNQDTNGNFLTYENYQDPWPRKMHSDVIQGIADNGLIGYTCTVILIWHTITVGTGDGILVAAAAAMLVNGIFFHCQYVLPANLIFWALLGWVSGGHAEYAINAPAWVWIPYTLTGVYIWRYTIRRAMWARWISRYVLSGEEDPGALKEALQADPESSMTNCMAANYQMQNGNPGVAHLHSIRAIEHFDGDMRPWQLWLTYGNSALLCGSYMLADMAYNTSLTYLPRYELAKKCKENVSKMIKQFSDTQGGTTV